MASRDTIERLAISVLEKHSAYSKPLKEEWTNLYNRYENQLRKGSITAETQAQVRLGQAFALTENFTSKINAQRGRFRYLARERGDSKPAEVYNEFSDYQHDIANSEDAYEEIAKWGGICGLSGFLMGWKVEELVRKKRGKEILGKKITNPILVEMAETLKIGKDVKVDETETISNWTITDLRPHDLIWDVEARKPEDSKVKGYRARKTIKELKMEGFDVRRLVGAIKDQPDYWREQMTKSPVGTTQGAILDDINVEVAELYIEYLNDQGVTENYVMTLAGVTEVEGMSPVSIRFEPNPFDNQFCPVFFFRPVRRPGKVEGYGVIEQSASILDAEEDDFNISLEAHWVDVARPMEYVADNILNEAGLRYGARVLIPVKELGKSVAVMDTPKPDLGASSFILGFLEKAKQNVSSITDYQTGANQVQKEQTAYEVSSKTFLSEQRINKMLRSYEREVLEASGRAALWLNKQYLANAQKIVYRILGKKGAILENQIKFKDIEAIKDLVVVSGSSAYTMQQEMRNKWGSLLTLAAQEAALPPGVGVPISRDYLWERMAEEGYGIKDSENLIPSLKEREEATVQQKLANLDDAKQENLDPATARVLPNDIHAVHIALHKAALQGQGHPDAQGNVIPYTPEQMVLLTSHLNAHVASMGGAMSPINVAMDNAMGQKVQSQMNPQPTNQQ